MLIAILSCLSALLALLGCDFSGLHWLWQLPLIFVGAFLGLVALAFGFFVLMCNIVDLSKPASDSPFYRAMAHLYVAAVIPFLGIRFHTEGLEKTPKEGRFLLVCNHTHEADPVVLLHFFKKSHLAFVSKRENRTMFVVGKLMHKLLCQLINRENDREALKTIINCIRLIQEDKASIGVFPEGYIHGDEKLHPFRSGVFKIAQKTKVPIVVCTLQNTQKVKKNMPHLKPTDVHLHLVGVVQPEELEGLTTVDIANRVHAMMAQDLGPELVLQENA